MKRKSIQKSKLLIPQMCLHCEEDIMEDGGRWIIIIYQFLSLLPFAIGFYAFLARYVAAEWRQQEFLLFKFARKFRPFVNEAYVLCQLILRSEMKSECQQNYRRIKIPNGANIEFVCMP